MRVRKRDTKKIGKSLCIWMRNDLVWVRSAECGTRNYPTTLRFAHKERLYKCGVRSTERLCLNAERRMQNAERLHYTTFRSQGKELNAERKASASVVTQSGVVFYYIYHCERSATKRSPFCILRSAFCINKKHVSWDASRRIIKNSHDRTLLRDCFVKYSAQMRG